LRIIGDKASVSWRYPEEKQWRAAIEAANGKELGKNAHLKRSAPPH